VKVGRANSTRSTGVQGFAAISDMNKICQSSARV
jgi:hypothetical protein